MILNHKRAIEMLVEDAEHMNMNRYTVCGLHAMLTDGLLADPRQAGRLRTRPIWISGSSYTPVGVPQVINEALELILALARSIEEPFERSFFAFVHLKRLQPFIDGNKRTARLVANIPLVRHNLAPLSFVDIDRADYLYATLVFYETQRLEPLRELYEFAYERSVARYQSLYAELEAPDPFRVRHRDLIFELTAALVRERPPHPEEWIRRHVSAQIPAGSKTDQARLIALTLSELELLHPGNLMRYRLRPSEFEEWRARRRRDEEH